MEIDRSYAKICPSDVSMNEDIIQFFETFYQVSDTAEAHEQYTNMFTDDATFILASKTSNGSAGMNSKDNENHESSH
jgi:hypothetical protein